MAERRIKARAFFREDNILLFKSSIGIEINQYQISIACLKGSFKGATLAAESSFLLDAAKSKNDRLGDISKFINEFIREHRISAPDIYIGIPGSHSVVREIELPLAVKENLRATLEYEIEKYVPMPAADIYFDFNIIFEDKAREKIKLFLIAVKKGILDDYIQIADSLETGVSGMESAPSAVANYYLHNHVLSEDHIFLVYSSDSGYDVMVIANGNINYTKSFSFSGTMENKAAEISGQLVKLKRKFVTGDKDKNPQLIFYNVAASDRLRSDIQGEFKSIEYGDARFNGQKIQSIPAVALALKGMQKLPVQLNLMPPDIRKKPDRTAVYTMIVLFALLIFAGSIWAVIHFMNQHRQLAALETELTQLRRQAAAVEKIEDESERIKAEINYLRSLTPGNIHVTEIVKELSDMIPVTAWITRLRLTDNELMIYGMAASASELISILESSPIFEDVKFLSAIRKDRDGKEIFRIGLNIHAGE